MAVKDGGAEIVCSHHMPKVPEFSSLYVIQQSCISVADIVIRNGKYCWAGLN